MAILHNQVDNRALKQRLYQETFRRITISFYRYTTIAHPQAFRDELYLKLQALQVFGRIYIATEGINAQISVPEFAFEFFKNALNETEGLQNLRLNIAVDDDGKSFWVLKIKVREKIVADGLADGEINLHQTGRYVDAQAMNALMNAPDTVVVDMRNHYEYEVGHFTGALEVPSDTFREQLPMAAEMLKGKENAPIVMYCTGGIRCEKASAYLRAKGFAQVHHLEGGIINYAKQIAEQNLPSRFVGKNFVFDDRMGERITEDVIAHCHQCGAPCDTHTNCKNDACHLLFIQCSSCSHQFAGCCTPDCAQVVKGEAPAALPVPGKAFHKAKERLRPKLGRQIH